MNLTNIYKTRNEAILYVGLIVWWIVNLFQAGFTELAGDEAYYSLFAQNLSWGYFDHPPMTALMVWLGGIFDGEFGVRFSFTLLQPLYIYILWLIIRPDSPQRSNVALFVLIASSMPILQLYGFIAVPDSPLMLFSALFLLVYKRFTERDNWCYALLLGVAMAALAYSKYHGALVVLITLLTNIRLLKNPKLYVAGIVALILIVPHLLWQYNNDWVSFQYHLVGRNRAFRIEYPIEYLLSVIGVFNPFLFPIFLKAVWKEKFTTPIQRALCAVAVGFILFFLVSTLRGHAQVQWVIPATFGIIAIIWQYSINRDKLRRYVTRICWVTLALIALFRIEMALNPLGIKYEIFNNKSSFAQIFEIADGKPVIFNGRYTEAAKYRFYANGEAFAQPSINYRTSQYGLTNIDDVMANRAVIVEVDPLLVDSCHQIKLTNGKTFSYITVDPFIPVRKIEITATQQIPKTITPGETLKWHIKISNPYSYSYDINGIDCSVYCVWFSRDEPTHYFKLDLAGKLEAYGTLEADVAIKADGLNERQYTVGFAIENSPLVMWFNSPTEKINVSKTK